VDHLATASPLSGEDARQIRGLNWADAVIAEAMSWYGTPYIPRARVKGVGCDCGTLLYAAYEGPFGPFPPFPTDYAVDWAAHSNDERYLDFVMPYVKEGNAPLRGGFSLFKLGLAFSHAAIFLGDDKYIHAWGRKGEGAVTITPARVLLHLAKQTAVKHFEPK
jgi:NlpC/P60 family putative phage cell wall peptidase